MMEGKPRVESPDFKMRVDEQANGFCQSDSRACFREESPTIVSTVAFRHRPDLCW
jgi:hypothetical protein